jgi:hypothetical protein
MKKTRYIFSPYTINMYSIFSKYYTFDSIQNETYEHYVENNIINLILYHPSVQEDHMKEVLTSYIETYPSVQFYFITLREQPSDIIIENRMMYINGNPDKNNTKDGILYKTIRAMEYCHHFFSFDYLVRSTISNIINFTELLKDKVPCRYIEYNPYTLKWLDVTNDTSYGTYEDVIVITRKSVEELVTHNYDWEKIF